MSTPSTGTSGKTKALELAASPTALTDRGGPGSPNTQQLKAGAFLPVSKLPQRLVSWAE